MLLDFKAAQAGKTRQSFTVPVDDPLLEGLFGRLVEPLQVDARISEQPHRAYLVDLRVRGQVEAPCRRCLTPSRETVDDRTTLVYEVRDPGEASLKDADDGEVLPLRSLYDRVDIGPAVREALLLAAETFPLCTPECKGLCPVCGEDLNADACRCAVEQVDPRWGKLQNLEL
jgi:uncharacterized protein